MSTLRRRTIFLDIQVQVVLEEIDKLLIQKAHPREYKLKNHLDVWPGSMDDRLPQTSSETRAVAGHSKAGVEQPLKVAVGLVLRDGPLSQPSSYLVQWGDENVSLEYVETLGLHFSCNPAFLLNLAPCLGHVRNLCKLSLASIHEDNFISPEERRHLITGFTPQLLKLKCLQKLHLDTVPFLEGHLHQLHGSMRTPLDDLAVTHCTLSVSDWNCHSEALRVSQWQQLNLENVRLTYLSPESHCILLVKTGPTLLTKFSFYGKQISVYTQKKLQHHTDSLRHPAPQESYGYGVTLHVEGMCKHCDELMEMLKAIRKPGKAFFGTDHFHRCDNQYIYSKTIMCKCRRCHWLWANGQSGSDDAMNPSIRGSLIIADVYGCQKNSSQQEIASVTTSSLSISCDLHDRKQPFHKEQKPKGLQETGCELMACGYISTQDYPSMVKVLRSPNEGQLAGSKESFYLHLVTVDTFDVSRDTGFNSPCPPTVCGSLYKLITQKE
ncbi:hypothetical protein U0070_019116 [Myodes glareolus]|uniref:Uncharacterized protein n=1 Tax=Myodes glareolus TaxID=447135 RepID=A0AAW0HBT1_MYOGA